MTTIQMASSGVIFVAIFTACGGAVRGGDRTQASTEASAADDPLPDTFVAPDGTIGLWRGTYKCGQGMTGLDLTVEPAPGGGLVAEFYFYAIPSNPEVPSGRFRMSGSVTPSGVVRLLASDDNWIDRPPGYLVVGLVGSISSDGAQPRLRDYQGFGDWRCGTQSSPGDRSSAQPRSRGAAPAERRPTTGARVPATRAG